MMLILQFNCVKSYMD